MDFVQLVRKLIACDTTPSSGNRSAVSFFAGLAEADGFSVEIQTETSEPDSQGNILIRPKLNQTLKTEFMLQSHLDTADPGPFGMWNLTGQNPFDAHIVENKIYGLGAADAKVDFMCKYMALLRFPKDQTWIQSPVLVGTFGEEQGMRGALKLIRQNKVKAKMAFIGEPTSLSLVGAAKGLAAVEIRVPFTSDELKRKEEHNMSENTSSQSKIFRGKALASHRPMEGESAIRKMLEYLKMLPEDITILELDGGENYNTLPADAFLEFDVGSNVRNSMARKINNIYQAISDLEQNFLTVKDPDFDPPTPTLNIGLVRTFQDHILISGVCRIPPSVQQSQYENWMEALREKCIKSEADMRVTDYKKPFRLQRESEFARFSSSIAQKLQLSSRLETQPTANEASLFSRTGIECICFGPGHRDGNLHSPTEHVPIPSLEKAVDFYELALKTFATQTLGGFLK